MVRGARDRLVRVLIADDDPRVRAALRSFLSGFPDIEVVGDAGNPTRAVDLARAHAPTVALVDVLLPEVRDGLGLLRVLTGDLRIPAVAISMDTTLQPRARGAGAYGFVDKDGSPELLVELLRAVPSR